MAKDDFVFNTLYNSQWAEKKKIVPIFVQNPGVRSL